MMLVAMLVRCIADDKCLHMEKLLEKGAVSFTRGPC